ncbi:hypothetical protein HPP92_018397 [Vanilla planifolia]|uniref:Serine aminopeptidase S33 domain-containing protein n=1 Tax=Vanilla planifolia TaxID=51239 RepID=A0A835QCR2_VANPL|nr:hypothetical protein HPP92_018397 [Vanilla planifolia]
MSARISYALAVTVTNSLGFRSAAITEVPSTYSSSSVRPPENMVRKNEESGLNLEVLYDDGSGMESVKDYLDATRKIIKPDGGPPRWFCPPECGQPIKGAPLLLFLPGVDGTGFGLILQHRSLGRAFEVRCLHVPVHDRSSFEDLVRLVEFSVKHEHRLSPNKPIYLVGDSFGGCLALAVAARNSSIDLVLVLVNPASSFEKSQLQPFIPVLENLPSEFHVAVPYALSFVMGDPVKMAMAGVMDGLPPQQALDELSKGLTTLLPRLSDLADIIPKETLIWKLKLLKSASSYVNSRLHAIKADVLVLASGKDNMLPSGNEADRLWKSIKNCRVRYFKESGHTLLLEDGINLFTVIKGLNLYRHSKLIDFVNDYLPPTIGGAREALHRKGEEYKLFWPQQPEFVRMAAMFDAKIVPFGVVGEDDIVQLILDYDDQQKIPFLRERIHKINQDFVKIRMEEDGEVSNQDLYFPLLLPKIPGRFYYLFGKPIETRGMKSILSNRESANALYLQIKSEIESMITYLKKKREEDPYRNILLRTLYQITWGVESVPTFEP